MHALPRLAALLLLLTVTRLALAQGASLGVQVQTMNPDMRAAMGLQHQHGVLVNGVVPGTAAARGGMQAGDVLLDGNACGT